MQCNGVEFLCEFMQFSADLQRQLEPENMELEEYNKFLEFEAKQSNPGRSQGKPDLIPRLREEFEAKLLSWASQPEFSKS